MGTREKVLFWGWACLRFGKRTRIQKSGKWIMALVRKGVRKQSRRKKLKGVVLGRNRDRKLHPPKCALASRAGLGPRRTVCRPHHCLQIPVRPII